MIRFLMKYGLYFAWLIALIATLCSFYYTQVKEWEACTLCWYQRICIFPLSIILGIASYRIDGKIVGYVLPQVIIGALLALYQVGAYKYLILRSVPLCSPGMDCNTRQPELFGTFSMPLLSFGTFVLIFFFLLLARVHWKRQTNTQ